MSGIIGTIVNLKDFLSNQYQEIKVDNYGEKITIIKLPQDRTYKIPDYQRGIRWNKEHLLELVQDISHGRKFLGNIILTRNESVFDIIDGQQRITIILMILQYIKYKFSKEITQHINPCKIENDTFKEYNIFANNNFSLKNLDEEICKKINDSDFQHQRDNLSKLWTVMCETELLNNQPNVKTFLTNLFKSEFNVICSNDDSNNYGIEYYLDVNLKGVKLDTEDIFKGYLFSIIKTSEIKKLWIDIVRLSCEFNAECSYVNKSKKPSYPLMDAIEHCFYCMMTDKSDYEKISFNKNFVLDTEIVLANKKHYSGEHILNVFDNERFIINVLENVRDFYKFALDVVTFPAFNKEILNIFRTAQLDAMHYGIFHNYMKRIFLDSYLLLPKAILMKYILENINSGTTKEKLKQLYTVYFYNTLFTVFEEKKITNIISILKKQDWSAEINQKIKILLDKKTIINKKTNALYQFSVKEDNEEQKFRCKTLASVYNFFCFENGNVKIDSSNIAKLSKFLTDEDSYSVEHFILNESKKCKLKNDVQEIEYTYLADCNTITKNIFNFIFISKDLNSELNNLFITDKVIKICKDNKLDTINCEYSRKVIEKVKQHFKAPNIAGMDSEETNKKLNEYMSYNFKENYKKYSTDMINCIIDKFIK